MIYTPAIRRAIRFSVKTHEVYQKQKRKGKDIAYITHPLTAGMILALAGAEEDVVVAGILHDTIEDSVPEKKVTQEMLAERFGARVAGMVASVSEMDQSLPWEERKREALGRIATFPHATLLVKSADVLANVSELLEDYGRHGEAVFDRFNAPKEKLLRHSLAVLDALAARQEDNPLRSDLALVRAGLRRLAASRVTPTED